MKFCMYSDFEKVAKLWYFNKSKFGNITDKVLNIFSNNEIRIVSGGGVEFKLFI